MKQLVLSFFLIFAFACSNNSNKMNGTNSKPDSLNQIIEKENKLPEIEMYTEMNFTDDSLVELIRLDSSFLVDLPYASDSNFTKTKLYPCNKCVIRYKVALALIKANNLLKEKGVKLKMLDCYRPLSVQRKMWEVYPNAVYVADPNSGQASMHNRGVAVDVTLVDMSGNELDMGTPFDYFGKEAWPTYRNFSAEILANRDLLSNTMDMAGFRHSNSEWWHFSLRGVFFPIEDTPLPCENK